MSLFSASVISFRPTLRARGVLIATGWILAGVCCLPSDVWVSRQFLDGILPGELRAIFRRGEVFGHAYGALGILITIYLLDPRRRRHLAHPAACFLTAGLLADLIKLQVWRVRPRVYVENGMDGSSFLGSLWTGQGLEWSRMLDHGYQSFPSAHTAGAVALAYSLGRLYPRGRVWFYVLSGLCAMNRIDGGAHFTSDVCFGVALGYFVARSLPNAARMRSWIDRRRAPSQGQANSEQPYARAA